MTEQLIILSCILSLLQPTKERIAIGVTFSFACVVHLLLCDEFTGFFYYLSAAFFDFVVLAFICSYAKHSRFTDNMIYLCFVSILLNVYGWTIYELYLDPISYNLAFQGLYIAAIYILIKRDRENESDLSNRSFVFCLLGHKLRAICGALPQEERF
jgi:hypothetical protein